MKTFQEFLKEHTLNEKAQKAIPFDNDPTVGWWDDENRKTLTMYHGSNIVNVDAIYENGIANKDPSTGLISMALEPFTARAYAAMSGAGGEANFRTSRKRPKNVPDKDRVVFVFELPMSFVRKHYDKGLSGNMGMAYEHMKHKELYEKWDASDSQYYQLCELRFDTVIPPKYLVGHMLSK